MNALSYIITLLLLSIWLIATLVLHLSGLIHLLLPLACLALVLQLLKDKEIIS